ncbi:MAG: RsmE family RNA methyltransferase [Planctomycetota bacterium]
MNRRFFVETKIEGQRVSVSGPDAHHLANVIRAKPGDHIILFDGSGREFVAEIREISKKSVSTQIIKTLGSEHNELATKLTIAVALPKGDRQKVLVEKLVELGVHQLVPLNTDRSVVVANEKSVEKLKRRVVEASKQCGRNRLMDISQPLQFADLITQPFDDCNKLIGHPHVETKPPCEFQSDKGCVIGIGPEGGFTNDETQIAIQSGWQTIAFGKNILRVETAAVAFASIFGIGRDFLSKLNSRDISDDS